MAKGRKAVPDNIHKLHGNFRADRHGDGLKVESLSRVPDPPDRLLKSYPDGATEWRRLAPELHKLGVLTEIDLTTLEMYCTIFDRWVNAEQDVLREGYMMETPNGYQQQNPAMQVVNSCIKQLQSLAAEFGMTPATRARMRLITKQPKQQGLLELLDELSAARARAANG